jgi:hypothetical protein
MAEVPRQPPRGSNLAFAYQGSDMHRRYDLGRTLAADAASARFVLGDLEPASS